VDNLLACAGFRHRTAQVVGDLHEGTVSHAVPIVAHFDDWVISESGSILARDSISDGLADAARSFDVHDYRLRQRTIQFRRWLFAVDRFDLWAL
jgi:hypothetical protein